MWEGLKHPPLLGFAVLAVVVILFLADAHFCFGGRGYRLTTREIVGAPGAYGVVRRPRCGAGAEILRQEE